MTVQELDALPIGSEVIIKNRQDIEKGQFNPYKEDDIVFNARRGVNGSLYMNAEMISLCGKTAKIVKKFSDDTVHLDIDNGDWDWCSSMLDFVTIPPSIPSSDFKKIMQ